MFVSLWIKTEIEVFSYFCNTRIGIPYEDDDYREGDFEDDRQNDIRDNRPFDHQPPGRFNQMHDMNRQTHFDVGGGQRDPPVNAPVADYGGYRGYAFPRPGPYGPLAAYHNPQPQQPQPQSQSQPQPQPHIAQQPQQPQQLGTGAGATAGYDGGRAGAFGYSPYGHYAYNPYYRPGYYGWNRPTQTADPWRNFALGFPFNLLGLGGGVGSSSAYRPWWSGNRWGLFF